MAIDTAVKRRSAAGFYARAPSTEVAASVPETFYVHELTIWRAAAGVWTEAATGVACYFWQPRGMGRMVNLGHTNAEAVPLHHVDCAGSVDLRSGDLVQCTDGPRTGEFFAVRGKPHLKELVEDCQTAELTIERDLPSGVS